MPNYEDGGFLLTVPLGAWIGRWRFAAAPGGGFVGERNATPAAGQGRPLVGLFGAALEIDHMLVARGHTGIDLQLAYDVFRTVGPKGQANTTAADAYRAAVLHGPRVAVRWMVLPALPSWRGFSAPPDLFSFGLAAFAGGWWQTRRIHRQPEDARSHTAAFAPNVAATQVFRSRSGPRR